MISTVPLTIRIEAAINKNGKRNVFTSDDDRLKSNKAKPENTSKTLIINVFFIGFLKTRI